MALGVSIPAERAAAPAGKWGSRVPPNPACSHVEISGALFSSWEGVTFYLLITTFVRNC